MRGMIWGLLSVAWTLGCGSTGDVPADAAPPDGGAARDAGAAIISCPGERPAFAACESGPTWASCGGAASAPIFACSTPGDFVSPCRWFEGGCVPEGWAASPCGVDDVCCIDGYPFAREDVMSAGAFFHEWGTGVWARPSGDDIAVSIAPLEAAEPTLTCTGALDGDSLRCSGAYRGPEFVSDDASSYWSVIRTTSAAILFWQLSVEVVRDDTGALHARVCHTQTTDVHSGSCAAAARSPDCAVSGTLIVDALPTASRGAPDATTRIDLDVTFADGSTMALRL